MALCDHLSSSARKRIVFWGGLLLAAALACFALIIFLAPRVINRDAVRLKIETTISSSLGGTVTYDRLDLVLVPQPVIELRNLKIDIPRAAAASIDTVGIYAKLIPLLLGRFDVSSVTLDRPALDLVLPDAAVGTGRPPSRKEEHPGRSIGDVLTVASRAMPDLTLKISRGRLSLAREGRPALKFGDMEAVLVFGPEPKDDRGGTDGASPAGYHVTGKAQGMISGIAALPRPLHLSLHRFDLRPERLTVTKVRARILDLNAALDGSVVNYLTANPRWDLSMSATIGRDAAGWLRTLAGLPEDLTFHAPLTVSDARLRTTGTGPALSQTVTGTVAAQGDTTISLALRRESGRVTIDTVRVKDHESDARLKLTDSAEARDLWFSGTLTSGTLQRIVEHERIALGEIKGDLHVRMPGGRLAGATAEGTLEGRQLLLPSRFKGPLLIDRFSVRAAGDTLFLQPVVLAVGNDLPTIQGTVSFLDTGLALDLDVAADRISIQALQALVARDAENDESPQPPATESGPNITGELRLRAAAVAMNKYTADDVSVVITIGSDRTTVDLPHASLCGIGLDGRVLISGRILDLAVRAQVRDGIVDQSLRCILHEDVGLTGSYDLSGTFSGRGSWETLLQSLEGGFAVSAKQGRIRSTRIVRGIIAYLDSTSLLKGTRSELLQTGFPYDAIVVRGTLRDGVIGLTEGTIKSREMHITAEGEVDLRQGTLGLTVLAAPFTSLDRLLGKIPFVKQLTGNALVVVPARVEGTFDKPQVKPLAISGVGVNLKNLMKNIAQAPVKIVEPAVTLKREHQPADGQE